MYACAEANAAPLAEKRRTIDPHIPGVQISYNTDRNGEILLDEMEECDLYVINRDMLTRVGEGGRRHSNLDLGFGTEDLMSIITYSQKDDTWGSDHYPVEFDIGIERKPYRKKTNKISTKKTDWNLFERSIEDMEEMLEEEEYKNMNNCEKYDKIIRNIKESVRIATYGNNNLKSAKENKSTNKINIMRKENELGKVYDNEKVNKESNNTGRKKNLVFWWDEDCNKVIEERKKAYKE